MAKLNGKGFKVVKRLVNPNNGLSIAIRSDGIILRKTFNGWKRYLKIKDGVSIETVIQKLYSKGYIDGVAPEFSTLMKWQNEGIARTPDGCRVEPDGICQHGYKSWLLIYGLL
ncbi:MAG: hypothetical protein B6D55_07060 [Candidatus Omnitrophica bacterium 4484_70.2]|nr:MAG: hypothetical protein B6D55_07060 [Candidatus Omnitrophica bacterium 4484_70.2]